MNEYDDLRSRLTAIDPVRRDAGLEPMPAATAAELQERIMQTIAQGASTTEDPRPPSWRQKPVLVAATIIAVLGATLGVGAVLASSKSGPASGPDASTALKLSAPSSTTMTSCVSFSVEYLRDMPVAFAGTVVALSPASVTLDVDRWYRGGSADRVTVRAPGEKTPVSVEGVDFVKGQRYLVTATDGTVNACGFTGKATPELEQAFEEAFPS